MLTLIETLPLEKPRALQSERLRKLMARLYQKVPFYREQLKAAGIAPTAIRGMETLAANPHSYAGNLAKNTLRQRGDYYAPVYNLPESKVRSTPSTPLIKEPMDKLNLYPNPSNGQFVLNWLPVQEMHEEAVLEIRTLAGKLVDRRTVKAFELTDINLSEVPAGVYYYQLRVTDRAPLSGRIIVQ